MTERRQPWHRRLSLRARMVLLTTLFVTVVLTVGADLLIVTARRTLLAGAVETAETHAAEVAGLAAAGDLTPGVPAAEEREAFVQVVSGDAVIASTVADLRKPMLPVPRLADGQISVLSVEQLPIAEDGPFRVVARGVQTPDGPATVLVAISLEDIEDAIAVEARIAAIGLPILVLALSAGMWLLLGRTLAPVEAIRAQAAAISGNRLDRRVPEPARQDEIGRLARTVNAMLARLQDSAVRQRRFIADAAHELRSPVTSLRTQLETAGNGARGLIDRQLRADLLAETVRMQTLVEHLLLLARTHANGNSLRRVPFDVDEVVEAAVRAVGPTPEGLDLDLSGVQPVQTVGDPELVEQLVRNLVANAVRHAERKVQLGLSTAAGQAVLTVEDDGPGIPPERRGEVFRPFTRLDDARDRDHGGVGLGLAIVADVVRSHGGSVAVDTAALGGARFRVTLPLRPPPT